MLYSSSSKSLISQIYDKGVFDVNCKKKKNNNNKDCKKIIILYKYGKMEK